MYFQYGQEETEYLSGKDEKLGAVIAQVGRVTREVDTDLFSAVVHHIVGQQISTKAQATIWQRMRGALGTVDAEHILEAGNEQLQLLGISCRKAEYITDFARKIQNGEFDLEGIWQKPDEEVIRELSALKGIGVWTAEMICFSACRGPMCSAMMTLPSSAGCAWCTITVKLTANCLKSTAGGSALIAAWRAFTCGPPRAARCRG